MSIEQQRSDYETLPVVKQIIESQHVSPKAFVFWAGGEPTLLSDFPESLRLMCEHGAFNEIATNSTVFCPTIKQFLRPGGNLVMKTSMDCGTRDTFFKMKGKDLFDKVWENLRAYAETGGEVSAKYIVSHDNIGIADLEGFVERICLNRLKWAHIDINHNFLAPEVKEEHIHAAIFLYKNLTREGIAVDIGVHSTAAIPDFTERVMRRYRSGGGGDGKGRSCDNLPSNDNGKEAIVLPQCEVKEYSTMHTDNSHQNDAVERIGKFISKGFEFFADVQPPELPDDYLKNSRLVSNRTKILKLLPQGGICAEVGTQTGDFAKVIWSILRPEVLHIYDIDFTPFDPSGLEDALASQKAYIHEGDSSTLLAAAPDNFFDFIYIDGDHSYDGVKKDLIQAVKKIKPNGHIVCNDYTVFSPLENFKYGVAKAVNELCLEHDFEIVYLGLHQWGYHDVALRHRLA